MPIGSDNMQARDRKQILIVEDEAINRELLTLVLQESYTLRYAATGEETLKEIFENAVAARDGQSITIGFAQEKD